MRWVAAAAVVLALGCGKTFQEHDSSPGGGATGGQAGNGNSGGIGGSPTSGGGGSGGALGGSGGSGGTAGSATCPTGLPGPALVKLDGPMGTFCIDATEVTVADYDVFAMASSPVTDGDCVANNSLLPTLTELNCAAVHYEPLVSPDWPVVCVDWCDARDYCAWAGKRLCNADYTAFDDPAQDEWMFACSGGGATLFPYGDAYDPLTCIGDDYDGIQNGMLDDPSDVLEATGCEGGIAGIFGMSGNVWEWTDACGTNGVTKADDSCRARGGSFWDPQGDLLCSSGGYPQFIRNFHNKNVGFRCCADPTR